MLNTSPHRPRRALLALATLATVASLAGTSACSGGSQDDSPDGADVSLGWSAGWTAPQIAVAGEEGYWQDHGLDVATTPFDSGRDALEALLGGGVDAAVLTEFPLAAAALRDQDVTAVAALSSYDNYRVIGNRSSGVEDIGSLDGKKVGVTLGTNMNFILDELLAENDVDAEIVNIGPADFATSLANGDIDAGLMFDTFYEPTRTALGDDYVEIEVPPELYTGTMLQVVSDTLLREAPGKVDGLVDAVGDATATIADDPEGSRAILAESLVGSGGGGSGVVDEATVRERWDEYDYAPSDSSALRDLMVREGEWIRESGGSDSGGQEGGGEDVGEKVDGVLDPGRL
ncbi:ABC transporter substrate-binding protein [Corynebacterium sp. AOP36-E1-14]|uniref:ABC transporter substrate-binding protein n=1 Tax=unclassified Corynebacterium TaxID=2624378 RepID=UPI0040335F42